MRRPGADGPPGVRRRRLRQDRGRDARGVHRRAVREAGRGARPHHVARTAASPDVRRPVRGLAGADRAALALPRPRRAGRGGTRPRGRHRRHRHRYPQAARRRHPVQAAGTRGHRRGAPLRRAPEGTIQGAAGRGRRAHPDRDADPPHPRHGALRPSRPLAHRHPPGETAVDPDVRSQMGPGDAPRSPATRDPPRRADLLRAQQGREHRADCRRRARARSGCPGEGRARTDARTRPGADDARLLSPSIPGAGVHHDHRDGDRHPQRQHPS